MIPLFQALDDVFGSLSYGIYREQSRCAGIETGVSGSQDTVGLQTPYHSSHPRGAVELHQYVEETLSGEGLNRLRLGYKGSRPYLSADQRTPINAWLASQPQPSVAELAAYIQTQFGVVFQSSQSYYELLSPARYSWKKTQALSPKADPQQGIDKREEIKKTSGS